MYIYYIINNNLLNIHINYYFILNMIIGEGLKILFQLVNYFTFFRSRSQILKIPEYQIYTRRESDRTGRDGTGRMKSSFLVPATILLDNLIEFNGLANDNFFVHIHFLFIKKQNQVSNIMLKILWPAIFLSMFL